MIFGIDVSSYQADISMARARAEGIEFVFAKVTEGTSYRNPAWPTQRDRARAAGMLLVGYHYVRTGDPAGEAAACKAWLGDLRIPIMLDWEQYGGTLTNLIMVLNAFRQAGLRVVLGYIPSWYLAQTGGGDLRSLGLVLVSSRYPSTRTGPPGAIYGAVTQATWAGYGGLNTTILQFTDRATVAGQQVDANAYLGTRAQLDVLLGAPGSTPTGNSSTEDDVSWSDLVNDYYTADPNDKMPAGEALAWGVTHAANARDAARQALAQVTTLESKVDALTARLVSGSGSVAGSAALTDADVQRIAVAVVRLLGAKAST